MIKRGDNQLRTARQGIAPSATKLFATCTKHRTAHTTVNNVKNEPMMNRQLGYVMKMIAKPGYGDTLRKLATDGMRIANQGGTWVHCRVENEPDTLWTFEFFENPEAKARYEESELSDKLRDEIIDLLVEPPVRIAVTPFSASWLPE
ncbi:putative quinol monooxygenase [Spirosoma radiotolerans]|uniref:ABM domain-containing protein n=1 Tax=Spirosoma radiotolerans TaxID=1379870 RepID=A0A0E3V6A6_9BACT|nr:hypothetical protein [Spirosoma radiotolerans]AKD54862.1 hypothetical protein SD10_08055 [Spirosoma radiotolerans]